MGNRLHTCTHQLSIAIFAVCYWTNRLNQKTMRRNKVQMQRYHPNAGRRQAIAEMTYARNVPERVKVAARVYRAVEPQGCKHRPAWIHEFKTAGVLRPINLCSTCYNDDNLRNQLVVQFTKGGE